MTELEDLRFSGTVQGLYIVMQNGPITAPTIFVCISEYFVPFVGRAEDLRQGQRLSCLPAVLPVCAFWTGQEAPDRPEFGPTVSERHLLPGWGRRSGMYPSPSPCQF